GRQDEALTLNGALVRRDPVNEPVLNNLGIDQRDARRYDAAIISLRTAVSLSPSGGGLHYELGVALLLKCDASGALTEMEQETSEAWRLMGLAMAYHALGHGSDGETALSALVAKYEQDWPYNIAYVYAYCGEADHAFAWLAKAEQYQDPGIGT